MAKTTPHKSVRIDKDIHDALTIVAKEKRVSVTWLINDMLRRAVKASEIVKTDN